MDWKFLDTFNSTAFKGWSTGWLWVFTGAIWGAVSGYAAMTGKPVPTEWLGTWLGGLTLYSGVGAYQYATMRNTDYGALERKAAANVPASMTTVERGAVIQQANVPPAVAGTIATVDTGPAHPVPPVALPRPSGPYDPGA